MNKHKALRILQDMRDYYDEMYEGSELEDPDCQKVMDDADAAVDYIKAQLQ